LKQKQSQYIELTEEKVHENHGDENDTEILNEEIGILYEKIKELKFENELLRKD